ncbi:MAG: nucleotidyl transferase AbiEii/AbiGii toxin family protein [Thaumarchaeota archaeon]|jgi:predicted nucleotidyltransferase component of viral defense system|nr:nucleotidyl transferase AbiEii/AbiGii toxin family protein [Nitrososphaerota archaeon]
MLDRSQLQELTAASGFNLWQTEKDYIQHVFLLFLSAESKGELVFKGGTALQKVYGLNRFSLDLDFTSRNNGEEEIVKRIVRDMEVFGLAAEFSRVEKFKDISKTLVLRIKGPLFNGSDRSITLLRVEVSLRRDLVLEPEVREIVPIYPDVRPYLVQVMRLEEILAEKVRAIFYRGRASDLYDLWFLLRKGVKMDLKLVNTKLSYYKTVFSSEEFRRKIRELENTWVEELKPVATFVPRFKTVIRDVEARML